MRYLNKNQSSETLQLSLLNGPFPAKTLLVAKTCLEARTLSLNERSLPDECRLLFLENISEDRLSITINNQGQSLGSSNQAKLVKSITNSLSLTEPTQLYAFEKKKATSIGKFCILNGTLTFFIDGLENKYNREAKSTFRKGKIFW
jgi:hypothetical protein